MGLPVSRAITDKQSEDARYEKYGFGVSGMQGWRREMEDAHLVKFNIAPDTHIFGVFDGHGGKEVALFVVKYFVDELLKNEAFKNGNYEQALKENFLRMDELIVTPDARRELRALKDEDRDEFQREYGAGCTANVALIVKNTLYVANAGDSRCVVSCKGEAVDMSFDHKPENQIERDRIQKAGGYIVEGRVNGNLNLSRALGDMEYKKNPNLGVDEQFIIAVPDVEKRVLTSDDDFIVLGCDGIWECRSNQAVVDFLAEKLKSETVISKAIEDLLDDSLATQATIMTGIGCDNMTCLVVTLK